MPTPTRAGAEMLYAKGTGALGIAFLPVAACWAALAMRDAWIDIDSEPFALYKIIGLIIFCVMAWNRDSQSSTHTVSGSSSVMTWSTKSALSLDTWAVPTRMISLSPYVSLWMSPVVVMDDAVGLLSGK